MSPPVGKPNFLDAIDRKEKMVLTTGGPVAVKTLSFGQQIRLMDPRKSIRSIIESEKGPVERAKALINVLRIVLGTEYDKLSIRDVPIILDSIQETNEKIPLLPWQDYEESPNKKQEIVLDDVAKYEGSDVIFAVGLLCFVFGWTADYVLNVLTYYEVSCYVQEAMMIQHRNQEFLYGLSEVGFKKQGEEYRKVPFPKLDWMGVKPRRQSPAVKMPDKYSPDGVIVDFSEYARTGQVRKYEIPKTEEASRPQDDSGAVG